MNISLIEWLNIYNSIKFYSYKYLFNYCKISKIRFYIGSC